MIRMDLRQLRYFAEVVEAGSLTAAATKLHLSQPSLSVAMTRLETEAGVPLLTRSPRGAEPTSAGRYLLDASSRLLGDLDDIMSTLARFGSGLEGSLTVAAVPVLMWHRLPALLRTHAIHAPQVEVRLVDPPPWGAIDLVQQGRADVAAIMVADHDAFRERYASEFDVVDWGDVPLVAALPPEPAAQDSPIPHSQDPLPLSAFGGNTLILPQRTAAVPSLPEAVEEALAEHGVHPKAVRVTETIQTSIPLIQAGMAWGILPDPDRRSLERFALTVRELDPAPTPLRALLLTRRESREDPTIQRLIHTKLAQ